MALHKCSGLMERVLSACGRATSSTLLRILLNRKRTGFLNGGTIIILVLFDRFLEYVEQDGSTRAGHSSKHVVALGCDGGGFCRVVARFAVIARILVISRFCRTFSCNFFKKVLVFRSTQFDPFLFLSMFGHVYMCACIVGKPVPFA